MNRQITRPKAIFFDAGETLVYPHPSLAAVAEAVIARLAPELLPFDQAALGRHIEAAILAQRRAGHLVHYPADAAHRFWHTTYEHFLGQWLPADRATTVAAALFTAYTDRTTWRLFPDVQPLLTLLRPTIPSLGILSNWEDWLDDLLLTLKIRPLFDHILVSGQLGLEKPDPAIFQEALSRAGVAPAELLYVGDSLHHDIQPCSALGIQAVLIDRHNRHPDGPGYSRLTDLGQLPSLFQ